MEASAEYGLNIDTSSKSITYNDISKKLLKDKLLLTALELHTELLESGKEVKQLKDFFSNPGNFEYQSQESSSKISRCGSQTTLDSFDFTRYSEDGERTSDERIAVLEFELRKAKETISALRNNLTVAIESEQNSPAKTASSKAPVIDSIKPHEQRALNFLINEYLLMHSYKLTSITFSDENENQDFEDWDDVGVNISKPAELLMLYREGLKQTGYNLSSCSSQTDPVRDEKAEKVIDNLQNQNEILITKLVNLEKALADVHLTNEKFKTETSQKVSSASSSDLNGNSSGKDSMESISHEHFEIIDKLGTKQEEDTVSDTSCNTNDWTQVCIDNNKVSDEVVKKNKISSTDLGIREQSDLNEQFRNMTKTYKTHLYKLCPANIPGMIENGVLEQVLNKQASTDNIVQTVSESLLRIIPNIILNKREEAIPLLISAVQLNSDSNIRDKLLQQLFNLKKKPSEPERALILTGIHGIAKYSKENVIENEILPQCWEQLTHKHLERRLLVAESCRVLIPFVSAPIRNSLMLSILQQMLEDREDAVREEVIKAVALVVALCSDVDKYSQCEELAFSTLKDSSAAVVNTSVQILFPVIAKWALEIGRLTTDLIRNLLHKLSDTLKLLKNDSPNKSKAAPDVVVRIVNVVNQLLPFVLMCVAKDDVVTSRIKKDMKIDLRPELISLCTHITNPSNFYNSEYDVGMILYEFDHYLDEDNLYVWSELEWVTDIVLPDLLNSLNHIEITQHELLTSFIDLFSNVCIVFGKTFTQKKVRPLFETHVTNLEQILASFNQYSPSLNILPVYLVSVLSFCNTEEVVVVLKRFLCALPLCGTPLDCLEITVKGLCSLNMQEAVVMSLWDGVVHQRPLVRGVTAGLFATIVGLCNESLLNSKVTPALVTLANDSDMLVRTATIPALGSLVTDCSMLELHDKAYMQLQMFLSDPATVENHMLLRQLVVTMGNVVISCKPAFRQDVILPQLMSVSKIMYQMSSQTRKIDMAIALIEAYSNVIYSPLSNQAISNLVLPGLRYLEQTINENQSLLAHRDALQSIIRECENRMDITSHVLSTDKSNRISQNVNQGVEEVKQRVSKIFNKPPGAKQPSLTNLQGFFKKK